MPSQTQWNARYDDKNTPWDLGGPSGVLRAVLDLGLLAGCSRVLVPGCGRGHDVLQLAERGHEGVGVDFAESAIQWLLDEAQKRELTVEARAEDILALEDAPAGSYDGIWEYTCFVAIPPATRDRYVALMTHLVRPGGRFVHGVFPTARPPEAHRPPWPVMADEVIERFGSEWKTVLRSEPTVSPEKRRGREELLILERV
jgi:cyclopropane fatty-acyl-phospholipid synthase-like methyltransferase